MSFRGGFMRCENCNIKVDSQSNNCPLCGKYIENNDKRDLSYPNIEEIKHRIKIKSLKMFLFISIVSTITIFIINMLTPHKYMWGITPIAGVWLALLVFGIPITKKKITPSMIILDNIAISIFLIIVDINLGYSGWAMSYVVPFILCGSALIVTIIVMYTKMTWKEFYLFQMAIVVICFIPIIARAYFDFVFWPSIISAAYGLVTILAMIIFGDKKLKYEIKKRFHV